MKLKSIFISAAVGLFSLQAMAALPPYWDRAREMKKILETESIKVAMNGRLVESVHYLSVDKYEVKSGECVVQVKLNALPQEPDFYMGPRDFTVDISSVSGC